MKLNQLVRVLSTFDKLLHQKPPPMMKSTDDQDSFGYTAIRHMTLQI